MRTIPLVTALALAATPALAEFEVEKAETEANLVTMELRTAGFLPVVNFGERESVHEVGVRWGVFPGWSSAIAFQLHTVQGMGPDFSGLEWSNTFGLIGPDTLIGENDAAHDGTSVGLYTAFEYEFDTADDIGFTIGPAIEAEYGSVDIGLNGFLEIPFGGGGEIGFTYAVSAMHEVFSGVGVGFEAHGAVEEVIMDATGRNADMHVIGPAFLSEFTVERNREISIRGGVFFGLTNDSPDITLSLNVDLEFPPR